MDKKLKIQTVGRDDYKADDYHHPYEPTPYEVLDRLMESDYVTKDNVVIDYGCGKGRVGFYLSAMLGSKTIGVEYDERMYEIALKNQQTFTGRGKAEFVWIPAENYIVEEGDCFYFFNPFTVEILHSVLGKIMDSYYEKPRAMTLLFYYPDEDYVAFLMTREELMFVDEIDCEDLFEGRNSRERILVFEVEGN